MTPITKAKAAAAKVKNVNRKCVTKFIKPVTEVRAFAVAKGAAPRTPKKFRPATGRYFTRSLANRKFPFEELPMELKFKIFDQLPLADLRNAQNVSKDWNEICSVHLKIKTFHVDNRTLQDLKAKVRRYNELMVSTLNVGPDQSLINAGTIRIIQLKNPKMDVNTLRWLFASCFNLEELQVDYLNFLYLHYPADEHEFDDFLCSKLMTCIHLCENLRTFEIFAGRRSSWAPVWHLDFGPLQHCTKLQYLNFRSRVPFRFTNVQLLPASVRKTNVIVFMDSWMATYLLQLGCTLLSQIGLPQVGNRNSFVASDEIKQKFQNYLPSVEECFLVPFAESEFELLQECVPDVVARLHCFNSNDVQAIINISVYH